MAKEQPEISESIQTSLLAILKEIEKEDEFIYDRILREAKELELYWHGFQHIFWDEGVNDFRVPTHNTLEEMSSREETKYAYDIVVNTFKAHGLSITAALTAEIPSVPFSPADPDNPKDIIAAKQAQSLGGVIQKINKSKLLFYHALFLLYTNHYIAAYNYYERDEKYGKVEVPKFKNETDTIPESWHCPECDFTSETELVSCPECSGELTYNKAKEEEIIIQDGMEEKDKGAEKILVKGALNVKIPFYAADQESCGYLIDYTDQHYAMIRSMYPHLDRQKIGPRGSDESNRILRMPSAGTELSDTYSSSLLTLKRVWLRPWMFDLLDEKEADELKETFPKGVYFAVVSDNIFAEARPEKLDDHWTIGKGDLSRSVHADPLGKSFLPLQDLENTTINLLTETLEHSVPSTWADPEILNFEEYSKQEVSPGAIYPAKSSINMNKRMDDYFFTLKTSTLSKEGVDFDAIIESKGQFVVGDFPSIFGGPQTSGSKTLGEYQESRNYALQRLSIPYQMLFFWWASVIYKSVQDHIANMISDEKYTQKLQSGKYVSVMVLMSTFSSGKFDTLIPESSVDLPISFSHKRASIQQMIQLNSEYLNQFLFSPENRGTTLKYLGLEELNDLDSNQTMKQLLELDELLNSEPIGDEMTGEEYSSVPIEIELDENEIHLRVIRTFLTSDIGQEYKKIKPQGYKNALLHAREHQIQLQMIMNPSAPNESTNPAEQSESESEEENVRS